MIPRNKSPFRKSDQYSNAEIQPTSKTVVICRSVLSCLMIGGWYYLVFCNARPSLGNLGMASAALVLYCLAGYFVRPEVDTSDLGWCGGLINNPFSFSDDANRALLVIRALLTPGRFIAESMRLFYMTVVKR